MPDRRKHRGPHPEDERLFAPESHRVLRTAVADLAWLLSRDYPADGALALVGDRHGLVARQRVAVRRACCSDAQRASRAARRCNPEGLRGRDLWIDGFNLVVTVEAALAGGVLLRCRDRCLRDMASMHGSYRRMAETDVALARIASVLVEAAPASVRWLLDQPVSNSGRLAERIRQAAPNGLPWSCELVTDPDRPLRDAPPAVVVATADSGILDAAPRWLDLASLVTKQLEPAVAEVDMAAGPPPG